MAKLILLVLSSAILEVIKPEPDYCMRGVKISEAYQHCFEEAHFMHPHFPLRQHHDILDGCMVEAYATHTCSVVKPAALECFVRNVTYCDHRETLLAIADESGGACYGNRLNREFKQHVLNFLEPVRGDSACFTLADRAYECYSQAGIEMVDNNPNLDIYTVEEFMPVANQFFDTIYTCFIAIYKSNRPICENWQIPLLLELQGTALPSLFGMTFTPQQMDRLELTRGCPTHHYGPQPVSRNCVRMPNGDDVNDAGDVGHHHPQEPQQHQQQQQLLEDNTLPPFLQRLRDGKKRNND